MLGRRRFQDQVAFHIEAHRAAVEIRRAHREPTIVEHGELGMYVDADVRAESSNDRNPCEDASLRQNAEEGTATIAHGVQFCLCLRPVHAYEQALQRGVALELL